MSQPNDFSIGDRVRHPVMGDGTVTNATGNHDRIMVTYDRHDAKGNPTRVDYDANWFLVEPPAPTRGSDGRLLGS